MFIFQQSLFIKLKMTPLQKNRLMYVVLQNARKRYICLSFEIWFITFLSGDGGSAFCVYIVVINELVAGVFSEQFVEIISIFQLHFSVSIQWQFIMFTFHINNLFFSQRLIAVQIINLNLMLQIKSLYLINDIEKGLIKVNR